MADNHERQRREQGEALLAAIQKQAARDRLMRERLMAALAEKSKTNPKEQD